MIHPYILSKEDGIPLKIEITIKMINTFNWFLFWLLFWYLFCFSEKLISTENDCLFCCCFGICFQNDNHWNIERNKRFNKSVLQKTTEGLPFDAIKCNKWMTLWSFSEYQLKCFHLFVIYNIIQFIIQLKTFDQYFDFNIFSIIIILPFIDKRSR